VWRALILDWSFCNLIFGMAQKRKTRENPETFADRAHSEIVAIEKTWPLIKTAAKSLFCRHWTLCIIIALVYFAPTLYSVWENVWGLRPKNAELTIVASKANSCS